MSEIRTDTINNASGDNDSGIDLSTNDQVKIKTANTTALTVDASQNVGIGTSSPNNYTDYVALTLNGTNGAEIDFEKAGTVNGSLFNPSGTSDFQVTAANASGNLRFSAGGYSEAMRINSSGQLAIGTSSPDGLLTLSGTDNPLSRHTMTSNDDKVLMILQHARASSSTQATMIQFRDSGGSERGTIKTTGSATAYNTSSDYRLKENVTYNFDATTRLKQLKPCRFNFIVDADNTVDGFLAHEVSSIVPEAISGEKDAVDDKGNIKPQGIDQSKLVPLLVKTIQELEARITALESE